MNLGDFRVKASSSMALGLELQRALTFQTAIGPKLR